MMLRSALALVLLATAACAVPSVDTEEKESRESELKGEDAFEAAQAKMDDIREDLASNQAHLRGVLDDTQLAAYGAKFWSLPRVETARSQHATKAVALAVSLAAKTRTLAKTKRFTSADPEVTADLRDAYENAKALANSKVVSKGKDAPALAVRDFYAFLAPNAAARQSINKSLADLEKDLGPNHALVMAQLAASDPSLDGVGLVRGAFATVGTASSVAAELEERLVRFAGGDAKALEGTGAVGKSTGAVVALFHLGKLAAAARTGHYRELLEGMLEGSAGDVAAISGAISLLEGSFESARAQSIITKAGNISAYAGRVAGAVGVVTSILSLGKTLETAEGDRLLHFAHIASDAASIAASMTALFEIAAAGPYVAGIVLLTQAALAIATYWHNHAAAKRRNGDTKTVLGKLGFPAAVAEMLANAQRPTLGALSGELGLAPADVQLLAARATKLDRGAFVFFESPDPTWISTAAEVKRLLALDGAETVDLLTSTAGKNAVLVRVAFGSCVEANPGVFANRENLTAAIASCAKSADAADERDAYTRLEAFAAAH